jgi:hypothetical protein
MVSPPIEGDASRLSRIQIRMRTSAGPRGSVFFITESDSSWGEDKVLHFPITADDQFHIYDLDMTAVSSWRGTITALRLDPAEGAGDIQVDYIRLTSLPPDGNLQLSQLLFEDDFSDVESGWPRNESADYGNDYTNGSYEIWVNRQNFLMASSINANFGDVRIEVEAHKASGTDYSYYGIGCRAVDLDNHYLFFIGPDGFYAVAKMVAGEIMLIGQQQFLPSEIINQGSTSNQIRADCVGDRLSLLVNGRMLVDMQDSEFAFGMVGLFAGTFSEPGIVTLFDNFKVFGP